MTRENRKRVLRQIEKDNEKAGYGKEWHIIDGILGEDVYSLANQYNCQLIYVDMDGQPQICYADYDENKHRFIGVSDWLKGNVMCGVIAYRMLDRKDDLEILMNQIIAIRLLIISKS